MVRVDNLSTWARARLLDEAVIDEKIAMICGLSRDWVNKRDNNQTRARNSELRIVRKQRFTPDATHVHEYVDDATLAVMPDLRCDRRPAWQRTQNDANRRWFWRAIANDNRKSRTVARIVAIESKLTGQGSLLAAPYGDPVSDSEIEDLQATLRAMRPIVRIRSHSSFTPFGMTPERALQIAIASLNASEAS